MNQATGASAWLASLPDDKRERVREFARHKVALDARYHQLGARFLAGSAATTYGIMPGSGMHLEVALLNRIGLSPREAIAAATTNYADAYGWRDVGRIEAGRAGDVVILDADPRLSASAIDHIRTIFFNGAEVDRDKLLGSPQREKK